MLLEVKMKSGDLEQGHRFFFIRGYYQPGTMLRPKVPFVSCNNGNA